MLFQSIDGNSKPILALLGGLAASSALDGASWLSTRALARPDGSDAGRRAFAQWLPIVAVVIAAVTWKPHDPNDSMMQRHLASIAMSVIFGTSVACLSLVLGIVTYLAPLSSLPASRNVWPFVLPASLLAMVAGFSAHLTWWHGLILLALGGALLPVWLKTPEKPDSSSEDRLPTNHAAAIMFAVLILCAIGAYLAVGATLTASAIWSYSNATLGAILVGPMLVMPLLVTASSVAQRGYPGRAITSLVGTVLLNLCVLLPITIFIWHLRTSHGKLPTLADFTSPSETPYALPYDMATWRLDTVIVIVLGFALVPISMGRWLIGRLESYLLILGYAAYWLIRAVIGSRIP